MRDDRFARIAQAGGQPDGKAARDQESLDERAKRLYHRINELKGRGIKSFVKQVADEEGLSEATVKTDFKKHADSQKQPRRGAFSLFDLGKPAVSSGSPKASSDAASSLES